MSKKLKLTKWSHDCFPTFSVGPFKVFALLTSIIIKGKIAKTSKSSSELLNRLSYGGLTYIFKGKRQLFGQCLMLKGVFSKHSGNCIVVPNFGYLLIYYFVELCKVWARSDKLDIRHFIKVPLWCFFVFCNLPKIQKGDPCKMSK